MNEITLPGLLDGHCHLDKTLIGMSWIPHVAEDSTIGRIEAERHRRKALTVPTYERARALLRQMVGKGTTSLRTHVDIDTARGLEELHAVLRLREETRRFVDIQIVAFPQSGILRDPGTDDLLNAALADGADLVGGLDPAVVDGNRSGHLDKVFGLACAHGKGIDIHLHERGPTGLATVRDICRRTISNGLQGCVTISHAFCLGEGSTDEVQQAIEELALARVSIVTSAAGAVPMVPVGDLRRASVELFAGSDNIRDLWSPFGNGDMLERAMLIAYRQNFRRDEDIAIAFDMVSAAGRRATGLGSDDDMLTLPAENISEAIASRPIRSIVKRGSLVLARGGDCVAF